ncbi:hypothetical protein [Halosolutus gelatinilyticus]|uniref:hypothetical protein n=1 Tax=Halosolutus gelatinilyticus TaxID=2931975 RepID=UPI001FF294E6|nr:hypothetical protein [Halosolutus gelatinilyticus]
MARDRDQTNLTQFDGSDDRFDTTADRSSDEPFVLELKSSARERNSAVEAIASDRGRLLECDSRADAESIAARCSERGKVRVRLQAVAPQDETPADAYLVAQPERRTATPIDPDAETWRFQPAANQYGAIGQALVTTPRTNPPALTYYVREDLGLEVDEVRVRLREPSLVTERLADGRRASWLPDVVAEAVRESTGATLREYHCEVKTGNASFERDQVAVMEAKADEPGVAVLKIRVAIDDVPEEYGIRIRDVSP